MQALSSRFAVGLILLTSDHPVARLWAYFDTFNFADAADVLHENFVMEFPQSRERFRGRDNFLAFNAAYPGKWRCKILQAVASGDDVVTETEVTDGNTTVVAITFFTVQDGLIVSAREYWPDPYPAPEWRAKWAEKY